MILAPNDAATFLQAVGPPVPGTVYKWIYEPELRAEARERALSDPPIVSVRDDFGAIYRSLLSFVGEWCDITDSDEWDRYVAAPTAEEIADYLGGGSWDDALRLVGVSSPLRQGGGSDISQHVDYDEQRISRPDRDRALRAAAAEVGQPLTKAKYEAWRAESDRPAPSGPGITNRWGWADAVKAADLQPGKQYDNDLSDMIDAAERLRDELSEWPTVTKYREHKQPGDPAVSWLYDTEPEGVGSWPELLDVAKDRVKTE